MANPHSSDAGFDKKSGVAHLLSVAWMVPAAILVSIGMLQTQLMGWIPDEDLFMWGHDAPVLLGIGTLFVALRWMRPSRTENRPVAANYRLSIAALVVLTVLVTWAGQRLVFEAYAFSRDEHLALFDAAIFAKGELIAKVAPDWRAYVQGLQPMFMLPIPDHTFWVSGYLPVNAAFQAVGLKLGLQSLVSPMLAALGLFATWGVARKLWPERPEMALLSAILLASSSQFLVTAMTPYAMTAHLALNMTWLWLFMRGGRLGHAGAIAVGFLACGLHQLIFHPLFVGPFILQLWLDRRWRAALGYTVAYGLICLFWVSYWQIMLQVAGVSPEATPFGGAHFARQAIDLLGAQDIINRLGFMAKNLVRFMTWQNPVTVPLALLGAAAAFRTGGVMRSLLLGMILTILTMTLLMSYQSHGWGYRYLHGFLGSACLLAAWTWSRLVDRLGAFQRRDARLLLATCVGLAVAVILPLHASQARDYVHPYAAATREIGRMQVDVVLVDNSKSWRAIALVLNDPFLQAAPLTLPLTKFSDAEIKKLCATHSVGLFSVSDLARNGVPTEARGALLASHDAGVRSRLRTAGCPEAEPIRSAAPFRPVTSKAVERKSAG